MPIATIGLFALALIVVALAFAIQRIVGDGDGSDLQPADVVATTAALNKTQTAAAGGGNQTQPPATTQTQQPGQTPGQTPNASRTPGAGTATTVAGASYTVKAGDTCGGIASDNGITLAALLAANNITENDCSGLNVGQVLRLR